MFYSVFFKLKSNDELEKILNFPTKEDVLKQVYLPLKNTGKFEYNGVSVKNEDIEFFQVMRLDCKLLKVMKILKDILKKQNNLGEKFLNEKFLTIMQRI